MSLTSSESSGQQLPPPPMPEQSGGVTVPEVFKANTPEQPAPAAERTPVAQQMPAMSLPPIALPGAQPQQTATPPPVTPTAAVPSASSLIDDSDLIEKEWVNKAKRIVETTRQDPYKQSEELTVVKADYMKKRYDKNIKLK